MNEGGTRLGVLARILRSEGLLVQLHGSEDLLVSGVTQDSRAVAAGDLFLAWKGTRLDAHSFLPEVQRAGATAAVVERFVGEVDLPQLEVTDGRRAAAILAHELLGRPTDTLGVTAVTGTNGKTTVTVLARHLLAGLGPSAALGTLGVIGPDGRPLPDSQGLTTPGPVELSRRLADLVRSGVTQVSLEASSHALEQRRLDGLSVDVACFTNLTRDHLDYHGDLDAYREAKARLLGLLRDTESGVVVNGDDPAWRALPEIRGRLLVTGVRDVKTSNETGGAAGPTGPAARTRLPPLLASEVELSGTGARFRLEWGEEAASVGTPLLGAFNVENALVAAGAGLLAGLSLESLALRLADVAPPPGRMEVTVREPVPVILDYAHTPDALRRVLETLRPLYPGRLIVVFGAGGDRDPSKRPEMGRIVARGGDIPVVTSDNPRTEDPEAIVDDIVAGMEGTAYHRITERREAIRVALELARPGDAVLLAGKGHETYQVVGTERREFDERVVVRELLRDREAS